MASSCAVRISSLRSLQDIEEQLTDIKKGKERTEEEIKEEEVREEEIKAQAEQFQVILEEQMKLEEAATEAVSKVQLEEAGFTQKQEFIQENLERVEEELERV